MDNPKIINIWLKGAMIASFPSMFDYITGIRSPETHDRPCLENMIQM